MKKHFFPLSGAIILFFLLPALASAQGTWTAINDSAPNYNSGAMILLTDGSVMVTVEDSLGNLLNYWNRLVPDSTGSYINGTWTTTAPMINNRLYFSSQVLQSGKLYVAGGEYGTGGNAAEVYDPVADTWTAVPGVNPVDSFFDANSQLLPDGRVLQNIVDAGYPAYGTKNLIYNPDSNSFTAGPSCLQDEDESIWLKLPDSSLLLEDFVSRSTERYIPALNRWIRDDSTPILLYDTFIGETGPGFLLPNGKGFFIGSAGTTLLYTPSGDTTRGSWVVGPSVTNGFGMPDAPGSMMPDGKVLLAVSPPIVSFNYDSQFLPPTVFYEYDYTGNTFSPAPAPGPPHLLDSVAAYETAMLNLPDGTIMFSISGYRQYYFYKPSGSPVVSGKPSIAQVTDSNCRFMITGTLFNGISQGSAYGDDWQMATNFPIVRLIANGKTFYARTTNWNRTGVQTGTLPDTAYFTVPDSMPNGNYGLLLSANGISSDTFSFTYVNCASGIAQVTPAHYGLQAIPNPAHEQTDLVFTAANAGNYTVRLMDVCGRKLAEDHSQAMQGLNRFTLNLNNIASGIYIAEVELNEQRYLSRIVVQ